MSVLDSLSSSQRRVIDAAREVGQARALTPYLVGGPVRDLYLGRGLSDLDIAIEHEARAFARDLGRRLQSDVSEFPQFMTFKVAPEGSPPVDVTTTRSEIYARPGALPTVAPGSLTDDLLRRDFSVNAIAIDLIAETTLDPTGGLHDLRKKRIRVLHDASFVEDPTRILRAIRLGLRLGFSIEPKTRALLEDAIRSDTLATVSRERRFRELFLAFREHDAAAIVAALASSGALRDLIGVDAASADRLGRMHEIATREPDLDRDVLMMGALMPHDLAGSGLSERRIETIREIALAGAKGRELAAAPSDEERFALCDAMSPELLAVVRRVDGGATEAIDGWRRYRAVEMNLRGDELNVPPGPHIAKALARTRLALFRREIDPAHAAAFARRAALEYLESSKTKHR